MGYIVRASELFQKAKEILDDGMDYVELEYLEEDTTLPGEPIPPSINFSGFKKDFTNVFVDYEDIDVLSSDQLD